MIEFNDISKALWSAIADATRSTDRNTRSAALDALRFFIGELSNADGIADVVRDVLRAEIARMEAF